MKLTSLLLTLLLVNCGKPIGDERIISDRIIPRTLVTTLPNQTRKRIKVSCYQNSSSEYSLTYILKGHFYLGNIYFCKGEHNSCEGRGVYLHTMSAEESCFAKKGFEEQFTLCLDSSKNEYRSTSRGNLIKLRLTSDPLINYLWCEDKILKIMRIKQKNASLSIYLFFRWS